LEVSTDGKIISRNQDVESFEIKINNETQNGHGTKKKNNPRKHFEDLFQIINFMLHTLVIHLIDTSKDSINRFQSICCPDST